MERSSYTFRRSLASRRPYIHHVVELKLKEIHVILDFPYVFPDDLLGMPPERAIEFKIQLQPRVYIR
jgi:hypothetical protein